MSEPTVAESVGAEPPGRRPASSQEGGDAAGLRALVAELREELAAGAEREHLRQSEVAALKEKVARLETLLLGSERLADDRQEHLNWLQTKTDEAFERLKELDAQRRALEARAVELERLLEAERNRRVVRLANGLASRLNRPSDRPD